MLALDVTNRAEKECRKYAPGRVTRKLLKVLAPGCNTRFKVIFAVLEDGRVTSTSHSLTI